MSKARAKVVDEYQEEVEAFLRQRLNNLFAICPQRQSEKLQLNQCDPSQSGLGRCSSILMRRSLFQRRQ
jgi:hypothetical protein